MLPPKNMEVSPMRTIIPFAENRALDPETIHLLAAAFDNAWKSVTARGDQFADPLKAAHSREVLAKRIIELAQRGERDSIRLRDDALAYLGEQSPEGRRGGPER
jgi:hypothetical protein